MHTVTALDDLADVVNLGRDGPRHRVSPIDWPTFWANPPGDGDYLVEPLIPRGRQAVLYATAKTGKSLLLLGICAPAASGRSVLGTPRTAPIRVGYLDYEMGPADLWERLVDLDYGPGADLSSLLYVQSPDLAPLDTPAGGREVAAFVDENALDLLVIDSASRAVVGPENDNDTWRALYRHTGSPLKRAGVSVIRTDNSGKDGSKGQRGGSSKNDDPDVVWHLTANGTRLTLAATHTRVGWVPRTVHLRQYDDPLRYLVEDDPAVADLARRLDTAGVPLEAGRGAAREALKRVGQPGGKNETITAALAYRRRRAGS